MLAAIFIMLMISPAACSTELSNASMGFFKKMDPDVIPYVIYEAANSSCDNSSDEEPVVWDIPAVTEATPGPIGNGTRSPKKGNEKK